jgi:uncharacterized protein (DUF433 family)
MPKILKKYISIDPQILGGTPVIVGTRIPLERVWQLVKQGYSTKTLVDTYPQVSPRKIQNVIAHLMQVGLDDYTNSYKAQTAS